MKTGVPFVAFSLDGSALHVSSLDVNRAARNEVREGPTLDLADLDERGREGAINTIGNYVLGFLTIQHPAVMNQFANLAVAFDKSPSHDELARQNEDIDRALGKQSNQPDGNEPN